MPSRTKILLQPVGCEEDEKSCAKGAMAYAIIFQMVIFFLSSVESCGGGLGISSREEEVWPSSSKSEGSMTMAIFLPSLVKS